jgi:hypothetical protein
LVTQSLRSAERRAGFGAGVLALAAAAAVSCGTVIGQVLFMEEGVGETVINAQAGKIRFWTDFSARYQIGMGARYDVELLQDGVVVATAVCDPLRRSPKVCHGSYNVGAEHHFNCLMNCSAVVPRSGPTTVRARFSIPYRPGDLRLVRADLIIRQ